MKQTLIFNLKISCSGWRLEKIKSLNDDHYYVVNKKIQLVKNYPIFFKELVKAKTKYCKRSLTFKKSLDEEEIKFFKKDNKFVIKDIVLRSELDLPEKTEKQKERELQLKINKLKFIPGTDDCDKFKAEFLNLFCQEKESLAKFQLVNYATEQDQMEFNNLIEENKNLEQLLDVFCVKYQNLKKEKDEELKNATLETCGNDVIKFIEKRFEYYFRFFKNTTFSCKFKNVIRDLPVEYRELLAPFENSRYLNNIFKVTELVKIKLNQMSAKKNQS